MRDESDNAGASRQAVERGWDYEQLGVELIRAWRGSRSLAAFSRRLGSRSNMVASWEAKRRWPTAARALWAAERAGVDVCQALVQFYGRSPRWLGRVAPSTPEGVVAFLQDWLEAPALKDVVARTGRSRYAVSRWIKGEAEPRLPDFLRLIDAATLRLTDFAAALADPEQLPSVLPRWRKLQAARSLAYEAPWSHAVLRALELESYRAAPEHDPAALGRALGIGASRISQCLNLLEAAGQVEKLADGRYTVAAASNVDTRQDPAANRRLKQWWAEVGIERLLHSEQGLFSYNLFSVSREDLGRLRELHLRYMRELRSIVASSAPSECVAVVNVQLFDLALERIEKA
jgi:transcriptional regulator with XRE-family HTH domain